MKNLIHAIARFINGLKRPSKKDNLRLLHVREETRDSFIIREATAEDIPGLAALHVKTWAETYPGVKKPSTNEIRAYQWLEQFKITDGSWFCFLVSTKKNELIGFAKGQKYSHSDLPEFSGELNKLYLLRDYQRIGLGRKLIGHVARRFLSMGINNMVLFGTAQNPSCGFHEALGGERLYANNGEFHGGYCWRDLNRLADSCPG
jgi:ribosomal protein S18 acetylase RimI-like enzyme